MDITLSLLYVRNSSNACPLFCRSFFFILHRQYVRRTLYVVSERRGGGMMMGGQREGKQPEGRREERTNRTKSVCRTLFASRFAFLLSLSLSFK